VRANLYFFKGEVMPTQVNRRNTLYGYPNPQAGLQQEPQIQQRAPTTSDSAELGTIWVNQPAQSFYVLCDNSNGVNTWESGSGGSGIFSTLTVNPGPTNLSTIGNGAVTIGNSSNTGAVTIAAGVGGAAITANGHAIVIGDTTVASSLALRAGTGNMTLSTSATGTITAGSAAMTGTITLGNSTAGQIINMGNAVNTGGQTINIASGNSGANSAVNILNGAATAGAQTLNIMASGGQAGFVNIANGAAANTVLMGSTTGAASTTLQAGTGGITLTAPFVALPGPVYIYTGAGTPGNPLALHAGDLYVNTTPTGAADRLFIATGVGAWTFFAANA